MTFRPNPDESEGGNLIELFVGVSFGLETKTILFCIRVRRKLLGKWKQTQTRRKFSIPKPISFHHHHHQHRARHQLSFWVMFKNSISLQWVSFIVFRSARRSEKKTKAWNPHTAEKCPKEIRKKEKVHKETFLHWSISPLLLRLRFIFFCSPFASIQIGWSPLLTHISRCNRSWWCVRLRGRLTRSRHAKEDGRKNVQGAFEAGGRDIDVHSFCSGEILFAHLECGSDHFSVSPRGFFVRLDF